MEGAKGKPPIEIPELEGAAVIPYIRGRLVFAQIAASVITDGRFTRVVTDLPHFLNEGEILETCHNEFPLAFSLIVRREEGDSFVLPLVPNDAGCLAAYAARIRPLDFECVDVECLLFHPESSLLSPDLPPGDAYIAPIKGLRNYFAPSWRRMDALWKDLSPIRKAFTAARAGVVASRLKRAAEGKGRALFVCEYRLWWAVEKALRGEIRSHDYPAILPRSDLAVALVAEDPSLLWARGFLDDYPAVNLKFFQSLGRGNPASFDKLETLGKIFQEFLYRAEGDAGSGAPLRCLLTFLRYLKTRVIASGRIVPLPSAQLLDSTASCFGKEFTKGLAKTLLKYPLPGGGRILAGESFYRLSPSGSLMPGKPFDLPDLSDAVDPYGTPGRSGAREDPFTEDPGRDLWADIVRTDLTRTERKRFEEPSGLMSWAIKEDYVLHQNACALVRGNITRKPREGAARKSRGSLGDGIDWKATIRSRAREERAIYIREIFRDLRHPILDAHTPHVFLFSERIEKSAPSLVFDANPAQRNIWLENRSFPFERFPEPDCVLSLFKAVSESRYFLNGHLRKETIEGLAFLYTRSFMGVERYTAICNRPKRFQCRLSPDDDPEIRDLPLGDRMVAWAVKYAERAVVVVAHHGWTLPEKVARFARERKIRLILIPLPTLPAPLVRRLRTTWFISTALKISPDREKILRRFTA
jgi:hypothetical protein